MKYHFKGLVHPLKMANAINLTPTKELIDKVTSDPETANDLLARFDSDLAIVLACDKKLNDASQSLSNAIASLS